MNKLILLIAFILQYGLLHAQENSALFKESDVLAKDLLSEENDLYRIITNDGRVYFQRNGEVSLAKGIDLNWCGATSRFPKMESMYLIKQIGNEVNVLERIGNPFNSKTFFDPRLIDEFMVEDGVQVHFLDCSQKMITIDGSKEDVLKQGYLLEKDGMYALSFQKSEWYDKIDIETSGYHRLYKNGLVGIFNITAVKYKNIDYLNDFLYIAEWADGTKVYIDKRGKEYFPK